MKKIFFAVILIMMTIATTGIALAAPNPSGTGQPNQSCQDFFGTGPCLPPGFNTAGFAHAGTVYAGSGVNTLHTNRPDIAVSQYDVVCFQQYNRISRYFFLFYFFSYFF